MALVKRLLWSAFFLLIALLLPSCAPPAEDVRPTESPPTPTQRPTATLAPTSTPTPAPTDPPRPSATASPSPSATVPRPSQTPTSLPTETPTPTPEPLREVTVLNLPRVSPDGAWRALVLENQDQAVLKVVSQDGRVEWTAETITEKDVWGGFEWAIPFHWSRDERYLYFSHHVRGDGCVSRFHGSDLHRLDLQTGRVVELAPRLGYWLALSPDETTLAYLSFEKGLVLRHLASGEERQVDLEAARQRSDQSVYGSHLLWSPDGERLVLTAALNMCGPDGSNAIVGVDPITLAQATLFYQEGRLLWTEAWPEAGRIVLKEHELAQTGEPFWPWRWLDADTGKLRPLLPASLYGLNTRHDSPHRGVWRLDPGATGVVRVTPAGLPVIAFDVWPGDGRLAYGTEDGRLYVLLSGEAPRLVYDAGQETDYAFSIAGLDWSPDGTHLAYAVYYSGWGADAESKPVVDQVAGLWVLNLERGEPTRLLANQHPNQEADEMTQGHIYIDPLWSPDGTALILRVAYWEGSDVAWLESALPLDGDGTLHDTPDQFWRYGAWTRDGRALLLSGTPYSNVSHLDRVDRATGEAERLIDGAAEGMDVYGAQELPAGIVFVAAFLSDGEPRLYLGQRTEAGFGYRPVGSDRSLCDYYPHVAWDQAGYLAVESCYQGVHLISLDGLVDLDLGPFLDPALETGGEGLQVFWGPFWDD